MVRHWCRPSGFVFVTVQLWVLPSPTLTKSSVPAYCLELLSDMGHALGNFDYCVLNNSRPFTACLECASAYEEATLLFSNFINGRSDLSTNCSMLIDGGKVSLVTESFQRINKIWNIDGVCTDCYASDSYNVSTNVRRFLNLRDELMQCLSHFTPAQNNQTCVKCREEFTSMSQFYREVLQSKADNGQCLCLDVLDAMNETRHEWGNICFSSPHKMTPDTIIAMSATFAFSILFYLAVRVSQKPMDIELARGKRKMFQFPTDKSP
ncbi:hypothetical protein BIW11_02652 [Tropilaelaps mercedesae]|uniref:Osteopetrosis-associated transmembrane protein 1-like n=1 Tax=Tropilaelaps mercedesae TaxID=418985 RepID=A0A1V9XZF8_9ACAR|nr:hypothetical protein BIW11_02652 [Tropilaelaps mercedesae]